MMNKFEKVRQYYLERLWNEEMCHNAVVKKWITADEFYEITGKEYIEAV